MTGQSQTTPATPGHQGDPGVTDGLMAAIGRRAVKPAVRPRAGVQGATPAPAAEAQPAPQPTPQAVETTAAPEPQAPEGVNEAVEPSAPTGAETDQELEALGYKSPRVRDRVRKLAVERAQEKERADQLESRLQALEAGQSQAPTERPTSQPSDLSLQNIPVQRFEDVRDQLVSEGEDLSDYDVEALERLWPIMQRTARFETLQAMQAVQGIMSPIVQDRAVQEREAEWGTMTETLDAYGTSRAEVEPYVAELIRQDPSRSVRGAIFESMALAGIDPVAAIAEARQREPQPPVSVTPGTGRTLPTSIEGQRASSDAQEATAEEVQPYMGGAELTNRLQNFWSAHRKAGGVRSAARG